MKKPFKINTKKPVTFDDDYDGDDKINKNYNFNMFLNQLNQLKDLNWLQILVLVFIILGPILFFVWLLRDTCCNYQLKEIEIRKPRRRKRKKYHRRLEDEFD